MDHRSRTPNFSETEVILLEKLVSRITPILENKATNAVNWMTKKNEWKKLASQFNAQNSLFRSAETLRKKWDNTKKIRQKLAQGENNSTQKLEETAASEPNCNQIKEEFTAELLNTRVAGPESVFDCDGDSKDDIYTTEVPVIAELDPLSPEREDSNRKFGHTSLEVIHSPVSHVPKLRLSSSKRSGIDNNCDYTPTMLREPVKSVRVTENKRKRNAPATTRAKWRNLAEIKIKLTAARLRHEREEHLLKMEGLKAKRREEEKEHLLRVEEARFRRKCLEVQHQEGHQEHLRRMECVKKVD